MSQSQNFPRGTSEPADDPEAYLEDIPVANEAVEVKRIDGADSGTSDSGSTGEDTSTVDTAADKGKEALSTAKDKAADVSGQAKEKVADVSGQAKEKVADVSGQAHAKADEGMNKAAEGVNQAADMLRQRGEQTGGSVGTAATTVADKLDSAGSYLQEKDTDQLLQDLEALIRRKPVESLLVAAGAGFVLSKLFS